MKEILEITEKYHSLPLDAFTKYPENLDAYAIELSKDLSELADCISRLINKEKHPEYYDLNESTIVGLFVKIVKLHKEICFYYENNKQDILNVFVRPLYEAFIVLKYLIRSGETSQRNFRLISYRARYENLKKLEERQDDHILIKRQLLKIKDKLEIDDFSLEQLHAESNSNTKTRWKLDGKSFWQIHKEVDESYLYSFVYGVGSDAIHGSWQEIMDFHLTRKSTGYFGFLNYEKCDCRCIVPINSIVIDSIKEFSKWNQTSSEDMDTEFDLLRLSNQSIYYAWELKFGEPAE